MNILVNHKDNGNNEASIHKTTIASVPVPQTNAPDKVTGKRFRWDYKLTKSVGNSYNSTTIYPFLNDTNFKDYIFSKYLLVHFPFIGKDTCRAWNYFHDFLTKEVDDNVRHMFAGVALKTLKDRLFNYLALKDSWNITKDDPPSIDDSNTSSETETDSLTTKTLGQLIRNNVEAIIRKALKANGKANIAVISDQENRNAMRHLVPIAPRIVPAFHIEAGNEQQSTAHKKRTLPVVDHLEYEENDPGMTGMKIYTGTMNDPCSATVKRRKEEQAKRLVATIAQSVGQAVEDAIEEQVTQLADTISKAVEQAITQALLPFIKSKVFQMHDDHYQIENN